MKLVFCLLIGASVAVLWIAITVVRRKKKRPVSTGQVISAIGTSIISIGVLLNAFECISRSVLLTFSMTGFLLEIIAIVMICRQ